MKNAETPVLKYAVYGAHTDLGSALLYELLTRQHEAVAVLQTLNSVVAQPGLRAKLGDSHDPISVSESVAGMDAVVCLYGEPGASATKSSPGQDFTRMLDGLLLGLPRAQVERLILVADFSRLDHQPGVEAALQRLPAHPLRWTLVDAPVGDQGLSLEDFATAPGHTPDNRLQRLRGWAAGIADELVIGQHIHGRIRFRD